MPSPFAAIEQQINQGALALIANAEADFGGGRIVSGVFDEFPATVFEVVNNPQPQFRCFEADLLTVNRNDAVAIRGVNYTVKSFDGTGMVTVYLNKA